MSTTSINKVSLSSFDQGVSPQKILDQKKMHLHEVKQKNKEIREKILIIRSDLNPFFKRSFDKKQNMTQSYMKIIHDAKNLRGNILQQTVMLKELIRNSKIEMEVALLEKATTIEKIRHAFDGKIK